MAEAKYGGEKGKKILSYVAKRSRRAQEKVMQKMGKSEQTRDEVYTDFVVNFNRQQLNAGRLHKELEKYCQKVKALHSATKSLLDLYGELYEPEWKGAVEFRDAKDKKLLAWEDLLGSFNNQLIEPTLQYLSKFPETKKLVEKRERKVVDYDMRRRELEAVRQKQKVTDQKIQQSEDAYQQAKLAFDDITDQLYEELPTVYDSRIQFYSSLFRNMGNMEARFHEEMSKVDKQFTSIVSNLFADADSGAYTSRKERIIDISAANLSPKPTDDNDSSPSEGDNSHTESFASARGEQGEDSSQSTPSMEIHATKPTPSSKPPKPTRTASTIRSNKIEDSDRQGEDDQPPPTSNEDQPPPTSSTNDQPPLSSPDDKQPPLSSPDDKQPPPKPAKPPSEDGSQREGQEVNEEEIGKQEQEDPAIKQESLSRQGSDNEDGEDASDKAFGESPTAVQETGDSPASQPDIEKPATDVTDTSLPSTEEDQKQVPEVLYKVIAAHPYTGEDEDELSFEKGEVICVIPFEDPDDQEEGWNFGMIETSGQKGMFPENFTKRQ